MPRANKAIKRNKEEAGKAYRRGKKEDAYKLWKKAEDARKEIQAKKRDKNKQPEGATE